MHYAIIINYGNIILLFFSFFFPFLNIPYYTTIKRYSISFAKLRACARNAVRMCSDNIDSYPSPLAFFPREHATISADSYFSLFPLFFLPFRFFLLFLPFHPSHSIDALPVVRPREFK